MQALKKKGGGGGEGGGRRRETQLWDVTLGRHLFSSLLRSLLMDAEVGVKVQPPPPILLLLPHTHKHTQLSGMEPMHYSLYYYYYVL